MTRKLAALAIAGVATVTTSVSAQDPNHTWQDFNVELDFSDIPINNLVANWYPAMHTIGVFFQGAPAQVIADPAKQGGHAVLGPAGKLEMDFVDPKSSPPYTPLSTRRVQFDLVSATAKNQYAISVEDCTHHVLYSGNNKTPELPQRNRFTFKNYETAIKKSEQVCYVTITAIAGINPIIDNLDFDNPRYDCNDIRDAISSEYASLGVAFSPRCEDYTASAKSAYFTFKQLASQDPRGLPFAILRNSLIADSGDGLTSWMNNVVAAEGGHKLKHKLDSAYRDPVWNQAQHGHAKNGRHMFGDAADINNKTKSTDEHDRLADEANMAGADFIETVAMACTIKCVHADWRFHSSGYAP